MRQSRDSRKAYRRNKQQQAVDAKAADEAKYFWQCVDRGGAAPPLAGNGSDELTAALCGA